LTSVLLTHLLTYNNLFTMADTTLLIEDHDHKSAKYYLPVFSAWIGSFSLGTVLGYSSPALPSLDDPGSHIQLSAFLKSLFVSLMALGAILGCIGAGKYLGYNRYAND